MPGSRRKPGDPQVTTAHKILTHVLAQELRTAREQRGLSRKALARLMPSGIGDRTLIAYELGLRDFGMRRYLEWCEVLAVDPGATFTAALKRANAFATQTIKVNVLTLAASADVDFHVINMWACGLLAKDPSIKSEVLEPATVNAFAVTMQKTHVQLVEYLADYLSGSQKV